MPRDPRTGFADPDNFGAVHAPLPDGWTSMTPLVSVPVELAHIAPPPPPMVANENRRLSGTVERVLTLDASGVKNAPAASFGNSRIIAASDAKADEKATAWTVCDGVADQNEINRAFTDGYSVKLTSGTYLLSGAIDLEAGKSLIGLGEETVLKVMDNASAFNVITPIPSTTYFANFVIDGNKANQSNLHRGFHGGGADITIENVHIKDMSRDGAFLQVTGELKIKGLIVEDCEFIGLYCNSATANVQISVAQLTSRENGTVGAQIEADGVLLTNFNVALNGTHGVHIQNANRVHLGGGTVSSNSQLTDNTYDNIRLTGACDFCVIEYVENVAGTETNAPAYGVNLTGVGVEDTLVLCEFPDDANFGTGTVNDAGTRTRFIQSHDHSDGTEGGTLAHSALTGLATGDPHTQYRLESADHSHASTGLQGGTVSHDVLTGVSADDHHNQSHDHSLAADNTSLAPVIIQLTGETSNTDTGTQNNWDISSTVSGVVWSGGASLTLTGIANGLAGKFLFIRNTNSVASARTVTLSHGNAGSTAANRFQIDAGSDYVIQPQGSVMLQYLGSRWCVLGKP